MVELRDCVQNLINLQLWESDPLAIRGEQQRLNRLYDSFTGKYGLINSRANSLAFADDSSYYLLCSLEVLDEQGELARKADMDSLLDRMPFRSACFTNLKDRKGLFAVISADEDRFQPLRQPKSSVREKLQKNPTAAKLPVSGKSKEQER